MPHSQDCGCRRGNPTRASRRRRRRRRQQQLAPLLVVALLLVVVVLMALPGQAFLLLPTLASQWTTAASASQRPFRRWSTATDGGSNSSSSSLSSSSSSPCSLGGRTRAEADAGSLALWEILRELEKLGVVYSVLQPREELARLLLDARRSSSSSGGDGEADAVAVGDGVGEEEQEEQEDSTAVAVTPPAHGAPDAAFAAVDDAAPDTAPPPPASSAQRQRSSRPSSSSASSAPSLRVPAPAFPSIADALAWAAKLSYEEMQVELEFLGVSYDGIDDEPTHSQLARLLARAAMREGGGGDGAAAAAAVGGAPPPPALSQQPKSRARQQRLLREQQQRQRQGGERPPLSSSSSSSSSSARRRQPGVVGVAYGGEEQFLDVDQAREELVAMRDRAMRAFGGLVGGEEPPSYEGSSSSRGGGRKGPGRRRNRKEERRYYREEEGLGLRVFEKATRVADRALDWATRARSMARGAMIAATTAAEDVDPTQGKGQQQDLAALKKAELQRRSRAMLGARGRRWSKLGGLMARAWAESAWQVVMASASWAGGGLLPGKYVLLGAGALALLLRQGLAAYLATLLVVRTCSSTLRNMIEDEEPPVESF